VYLAAPEDVRARRVAERDGISENDALRLNKEREASERKRYREYYDIDPDDLSAYDLVVNTVLWDADGVANVVASAILALRGD